MHSLFVLGFFFYDIADIVDIFVEIIISLNLFLFFKTLLYVMSIEAFSICYSNSSQIQIEESEISPEMLLLIQEIKSMPLKNISTNETKKNCAALILLLKRKFKHPLFPRIFGETVIKTKNQALNFLFRLHIIIIIYAIIIPLCFIASTIIDKSDISSIKFSKILISIAKGGTTIYCIYYMIYYVKNIENILKEYGLLSFFFCIKLIILFFTVQTIVLSFVNIETDFHSSDEMRKIINYFILNIESCLLGMLWINNYGHNGLGLEKIKNISSITKIQNIDNKNELKVPLNV